jgi:hypothetical protein
MRIVVHTQTTIEARCHSPPRLYLLHNKLTLCSIFYDKFGDASTARLQLKQWDSASPEPSGLRKVVQEPPADGSTWKFIGMMGDWDESFSGTVLSRVSGIWRRA